MAVKKKQTLDVQQAFIKKYELLVDQVSQKYGKSVQKGDLSELAKIDLKGGLTRGDQWKPNDSSEVSLYAVLVISRRKKGVSKLSLPIE